MHEMSGLWYTQLLLDTSIYTVPFWKWHAIPASYRVVSIIRWTKGGMGKARAWHEQYSLLFLLLFLVMEKIPTTALTMFCSDFTVKTLLPVVVIKKASVLGYHWQAKKKKRYTCTSTGSVCFGKRAENCMVQVPCLFTRCQFCHLYFFATSTGHCWHPLLPVL